MHADIYWYTNFSFVYFIVYVVGAATQNVCELITRHVMV